MKIIQIVGYKNSGKTALAVQLIQRLVEKNMRTASLKHHGHGGRPLGLEATDSERHKRAGAVIVGVEGDGMLQLSTEREWDLEQLIKVYELFEVEVLVVEGFKQANYPKIVLIRKEEDVTHLKGLTQIIAVVSDFALVDQFGDVPTFSYEAFEVVCQFYIENYILN